MSADICIADICIYEYLNYVTGVMFTSYLTKSIRETKKNYYIRDNKLHAQITCIEEMDDVFCGIDNSAIEKFQIDDIIEDTRLFYFLKKLTLQQKTILYDCYIDLFNETEVAKKLGISKQAVNKMKRKILAKAVEFKKGYL